MCVCVCVIKEQMCLPFRGVKWSFYLLSIFVCVLYTYVELLMKLSLYILSIYVCMSVLFVAIVAVSHISSLNSGITESKLDRMAVINLSHRQAILSKAQSGGDQGVDFGDDFDAVLGDLTSAIADLEAISVVSDVYTFIYIYLLCLFTLSFV